MPNHKKFSTNILDLRAADDYDPEDEEALKDEEFSDDQFFADASGLLTSLFKTFGVNFLPIFDLLLGKLSELLASQDASARQWAICIFCDLIEFTGPNSSNYQEYFLNSMASGLSDASADVRQSCAYGVGVAASHGGPLYSSFCQSNNF